MVRNCYSASRPLLQQPRAELTSKRLHCGKEGKAAVTESREKLQTRPSNEKEEESGRERNSEHHNWPPAFIYSDFNTDGWS